ncbi:DUF6011 domain-containing protein [Lentzea sp. NPDC092896]|uniref:DUF6011 domain-containing protein n=1 Tax=Lentzea sp. NPDC092896 TaxID=3364127 RepID=UPI00381B3CFB
MTATQTTAKCLGCGRVLRAAKSIAAGRGRRCAAKVREAIKVAAFDYKPEQIVKAAELIELKAIVRTTPATFAAVSSNGANVYEIDQYRRTCTCKAGERGVRCYHLAAAQILTAA